MAGNKTAWYAAGLHFECQGCGGCCSGPGEGYIWVTRREIEIIADFLKLTVAQVRREYLKRVGLRTTIIEEQTTKDCIFLQEIGGRKGCLIYSVRPNQCRNWPFWPENLKDPNAWNKAAQKCPGINRGRLYGFEEIEEIKKNKKWWKDVEDQAAVVGKVAAIYDWLEDQLQQHRERAGACESCGRCCDFEGFDHRLFVTPPELMYLAAHLGGENIKAMPTGRCPYNLAGKCSIYEHRFAGCRIFCCKGDADFQSELSEAALTQLKSLCTELEIAYEYRDLATALNALAGA